MKEYKSSVMKIKIYFVEQDSEIDCSSVMNNMFVKEEKKEVYIYIYCDEDHESIMKIAYSHKYISLCINSLSFLKHKKLTIILLSTVKVIKIC
jgi:hypothetical protein